MRLSETKPRVSVIIPTFNRASLVKRAIQSVLAQSYPYYEVVVGDDGSTDDTEAIVGKLAAENPDRVRYLQFPHHGRSSARNQAIQKACGEYIAFLDSDDVYFPHTLQMQVDKLEAHPEAGMVYGPAICVDEQGKHLFTFEAGASGWIYRKIAFYQPLTVTLPSVMVRRTVLGEIGGFDERMDRFEDIDMWRRISRRFQILAIQTPLCQLMSHEGNRLRDPMVEYQAVQYYVNKVFIEDRDEKRLFLRRSAANLFIRYGRAVWDSTRGCVGSAPRFAWRALLYWPFDLRGYFLLIPKCVWQPLRIVNKILHRTF